MKKVLKALFYFGVEIIFLPVSILLCVFALLFATWCNKFDKDEWKSDIRFCKNTMLNLFKTKIDRINS